jgi:Trypsin
VSSERKATVVRLRDVNLNEVSQNEVTIDILEKILHPNYRISLQYNDIALIKLARNISLSGPNATLPICLSTQPRVEPGTIMTAIGFGFTESMYHIIGKNNQWLNLGLNENFNPQNLLHPMYYWKPN